MPGKNTTDGMFALRMLIEKYREGQNELHCVFVDLEKVSDRVLREQVWLLYEKVRTGREVCKSAAGYV